MGSQAGAWEPANAGAHSFGYGCRNPASKDAKLEVTAGVLVPMALKLLVSKSLESSACTAEQLDLHLTECPALPYPLSSNY